ncbi:MBL fold metallo-hydrolase [Streptomyces sp. NBC_00237]|uniref:MBL fold metallo-hydrolase n=1 Tax=Streptomyces sp. NBC_00237 TaxID=2975687 RepID=UPI0022590DD2|nr:MBL fold metallo-hydrolase [Streptomyces sp. NBC_00237]MCX5202899.1 MBL fold metallo-hydrolase [Streptomyces sp. NBC_00237]
MTRHSPPSARAPHGGPSAEDHGGPSGEGPARRTVLRTAAATAFSAAALWADAAPAGAAAAAGTAATGRIVRHRAGPFEVLALLDVHGPFPGRRTDHFTGATADDWARAKRIDPRAFGPADTWELDFRCYAVRRPGGRVTLVDTGVGPADSPAAPWAPVPGHLPQVLAEAGIRRRDVDTVVLTHLHEDHYGWSVSPAGEPMFPEARYVLQRAETEAVPETDTAHRYVLAPLRRTGQLHEVDGRTRLFRPGKGRSGAITLLPTPGHTPGHQSVLVDGGAGGDRRIMVTGDVLVHAVQLVDPAVAYRFEKDADAARHSREQLLREARAGRALLATAHLNTTFLRAP